MIAGSNASLAFLPWKDGTAAFVADSETIGTNTSTRRNSETLFGVYAKGSVEYDSGLRRRAAIFVCGILLILAVGCGEPAPKSDAELGLNAQQRVPILSIADLR